MVFPYDRKRRRSTHGDDDPASGASNRGVLNDDFSIVDRTSRYDGVQDTFSHDDYTVGWICALPIEMAAAKAMLDTVHETLPPSQNDSNAYTLGSIAGHKIAIACLPSGQYGNNNAASVASNLRRTFPSIRVSLMVGIGGGAPGKADVRLGDVVVSDRVVQYDLGKTIGEGQFTRTGAVRSPPRELLTAIAKLRADHDLEPSRVSLFLSEMLRRYPSMSTYIRNSSLQDQLFDGQYDHVVSSVDSCQGCDKSRLVYRPTRNDTYPKIHYGVVASGNQVIKHGGTRDKLARELDAICFEMEAAGLMDSVPGLAIRGICDYSDTHKNKNWQQVAAAVAAAYAKKLLLVIPAQMTKTAPPVSTSLGDSGTDRRKTLLSCLKFDQIDVRRSGIKAKYGTTCQWLLVHPDYVDWLDPSKAAEHHGFLWISGNPGTGKSTIMNFACTQAAKDKTRVVLSFFFNARGDDIEKSTAGMYRSLLFQLLNRLSSLLNIFDDPDHNVALDEMHTAVVRHGRQSEWPVAVLQGLLRSAILRLGQQWLTIFVDALDECKDNQVEEMVEFFEELGQHATDNGLRLTICFSSRHYPFIDIQYGRRLTLEHQEGQEIDIAMYINSKLKIGKSKTAEEIKTTLQTKACRIFMWVVLVVDILTVEYRNGRIFDVKKRLDILPTKLNDLFREILLRDQNNLEDMRICIQWLLFAKRPLRLEEYYFAAVSGLNPNELRKWDAEEVTTDDMRRFVLSSSKGLAETTRSKASIVQFIHESVREFFLKDGLQQLWPEVAGPDFQSISHSLLQQCCHVYIKLDIQYLVPSTIIPSNDAQVARAVLSYGFPFLEYTTSFILHHAEAAGTPLHREFLANFDRKSWIGLSNIWERHAIRRYKQDTSIMYILAEKNLPNLIIAATSLGLWAFPGKGRYRYPFFAAVANESRDAVRALLQNGTEELPPDMLSDLEYGRNLKVPKGETPLSWAAGNGHEAVVRLLLPECSIDRMEAEHLRSLVAAIRGRHSKIARFLIASIGNVNENEKILNWLLVEAARSGQDTIIQLLIDKGADAWGPYEWGGSPLKVAAKMGHESSVRLLLENGFGVNADERQGMAPLSGDEDVVGLFLEKHADVDTRVMQYMTPLYAAAMYGHKAIVRLLLENGADVNAHTIYNRTPLWTAAAHGHEAVVRLLLENGADVDAGEVNGTPLWTAAYHGHEAVVRFLLENGADINGRKTNGTPLWAAVFRGHEAVVRLLLEKGADLQTKDPFDSPPYFALINGNTAVARLLLENGADADARVIPLALELAAERGHDEIIQLLKAHTGQC